MSTVDSTPPELSSRTRNRFVAGRATCSANDQVGDAIRNDDNLKFTKTTGGKLQTTE